MKFRIRRLTLGALGILLLVALFAALAPLSLRTDNATYAQTETTAVLPAPSLTADAKGANAVELNWTAVPGAARYHIALYTVADGHQRLDDVVAPATTYTHPELTAGTTYYYWVRALSAAGKRGEWSDRKGATASDEQSSTPTPTPASNATPTPTATPAATASPTATATPGLNATATPTVLPTATATPTSNATPTATASTQTTATPTLTPAVTGKLPAPALTADAKGMNAVELNWTAVAGAARYHLALYTVADGHQRLDDVVAPTTTYTHPSLTAGTTYYYWVRAASASGEEGEWSVRMHATASATQSSTATPTLASNATATPTVMPTATATPASTPTPTPTATASTQPTATPTLTPNITGKLPAPALTADAKGANAVELNWTAVSGAARYHLALFTVADGHQRLDDVVAPATTFTHPDLTAGRTYYYWVRGVSAAGEEGDWSERKHATVAAAPSPTATPTVTPAPADRERAALIALYNATGGANWRRSVNWLSNEPLSTWSGVYTDENGHVTTLSPLRKQVERVSPGSERSHLPDQPVPLSQPVERTSPRPERPHQPDAPGHC